MFGANWSSHTIVWTSVAAIFLGLTAVWWQDWRRKKLLLNAIPNQWRTVGEVDELLLYPLKSGRRIPVTEAECTDTGLQMMNVGSFKLADRIFLVYNEKNSNYITARQKPKMILISVSVGFNGKVIFEGPEMTSKLIINIPDPINQHKICSMWFEEKVETVDCGDDAATWFSEYLLGGGQKSGLRLGYFPGMNNIYMKRNADSLPWSLHKRYFSKIRNEDYGIYSDLASFMILGANSVAELNTRLATPVTAYRFRPNILVKGSEPYAEDNWDWIKIGDSAVFRSIKPCTRCVITMVDPERGVMDIGTCEPLVTLKKYRQLTDPGAVALEGDSPVMGQYLGLHARGIIKVGDKVYVGSYE